MRDTILAAVVTRPCADKVRGAQSVFIAEDEDERARTAALLGRILKAMAHDLENGVTIIVQH